MQKRVLITGAAGFLGSHLCDRDIKNCKHLQFLYLSKDSKHVNLNKSKMFWLFGMLLCLNILISQNDFIQNKLNLKIKRLDDSEINTYIYNQNPKKKQPLLILCQGSGYEFNHENYLKLISLFGDKMAGLVIEKQGAADTLTDLYKQHNAIYNRVYDYLRVLQFLRQNSKWWDGTIYVAGGSEGGLVAGLIGSFYPNTKGIAIFSYGGGLKYKEVWPLSFGIIKKKNGVDSITVSFEILKVKDTLDFMKKNPTYSKSFNGQDNTYAWWNSIMDLRLSNALLDLNIPIFVGQGLDDIMVPPISALTLQKEFNDHGKSNLYLKNYENYDHLFIDKNNKSHLAEVFVEGVNWIIKK